MPSLAGSPSRLARVILPVLALLLLVGAALRILPLPHEALSGDEMFSRRVVLLPLGASLQAIREDLVHPPLYYLLLKAGTGLWGAGPTGLRALSLFFGLLTLPLLTWLGWRLPGGRWCGLLAAGCVASGRNTVFYSQEARSYAFYTALVVGLVLWLTRLSTQPEPGSPIANPPRTSFWIGGGLLMTVLVYTHYVGAVYIALAVLAVWISRVTLREKLGTLGCGLVAALLFVPWLLSEVSVLHAKHGLGDNLDWQGHPAFYDLRQVWANSLGVASFPGATMVALLLIVVLAGLALRLAARSGALASSPAVLALALMGVLPPAIMFALSEPPVNLSLFALRHVLPSTVLLLMLCCYGLELAVGLLSDRKWASFATAGLGAVCLLALAELPTASVLLSGGPSRYPYDRVEQVVAAAEQAGKPTFAEWFYGEGEPVNFYCGHACVQPVPASDDLLPAHLLLLYRPASGREKQAFQRLQQEGWQVRSKQYFTDGPKTPYGTAVVELARP